MNAPQILRVAVVDDEPLARQRMRRLLSAIPDVAIAFEATDVEDLLAKAQDTLIDVVFMDIEMPGGDGFTALTKWPGARPQIIFVTAYEQHGVRAFDARALDYLLKPVEASRLQESLKRAREAIAAKPGGGDEPPAQLSLTIGNHHDLVSIDDIDVVIARRNYLELHTRTRQYVVRRPLHDFHASLRSSEFIRLHRSIVVRRGAIRRISPIGSGRYKLELIGGQLVSTGRNYRAEVQALIR